MRGVAYQKAFSAEWIVWRTLDGDQRVRFVVEKGVDQFVSTNQIDRIWEMRLEELQQLPLIGDLLKVLERHEKRYRVGFVLVRQCYHHEVASGPNVHCFGQNWAKLATKVVLKSTNRVTYSS